MKPVTKELENKEKGVHNLYKNQDQLENAEPTKNTHTKKENIIITHIKWPQIRYLP